MKNLSTIFVSMLTFAECETERQEREQGGEV